MSKTKDALAGVIDEIQTPIFISAGVTRTYLTDAASKNASTDKDRYFLSHEWSNMTNKVISEHPEEMIEVANVRTAIKQYKNIIDVVKINNMAKAAVVFYAAQGMEENAQKAREASLWAQRKAGEFLNGNPKNEGGRPKTGTIVVPVNAIPTLADLDIDKHESSRWQMLADIPEDTFEAYIDDKISKGYELTAGGLLKIGKIKKAHEAFTAQTNTAQTKATVEVMDACQWLSMQDSCDLLLTDPPYMTDVQDINIFSDWIRYALDYVKPTGRAYVFIGAYPEEVKAYLNTPIPKHMELCQLLVWTYKNTLGNNPKDRYKLNYQTCLYYKGVDAPDLDCPITNEQWAVQEINAPDGRLGDRYHTWQKPLEIASRFIRHSTKEGDVVYDPFACTGTFLLAAANLGRIARGCDTSKENLDIAIERGCKYA